jgi:hypothetical protein
MSTKKILKLRDHWYYTAIGESHRESANIARETAAALDIVLKSKPCIKKQSWRVTKRIQRFLQD